MKYDCKKTLDYAHEVERMCRNSSCSTCPFRGLDCSWEINQIIVTQEHIDALQKWSDAHPVKTRQDVFMEIYPNAEVDPQTGALVIGPCFLDNKTYGFADCDSRGDDGCAKCKADYWLAEVNE